MSAISDGVGVGQRLAAARCPPHLSVRADQRLVAQRGAAPARCRCWRRGAAVLRDGERVAAGGHAVQLQLEAVQRYRRAGAPVAGAAGHQRIAGAVAQLPGVGAGGRGEGDAGVVLRVRRRRSTTRNAATRGGAGVGDAGTASSGEAAARPRGSSSTRRMLLAARVTGCSRKRSLAAGAGAPTVMRTPSTVSPLAMLRTRPSVQARQQVLPGDGRVGAQLVFAGLQLARVGHRRA